MRAFLDKRARPVVDQERWNFELSDEQKLVPETAARLRHARDPAAGGRDRSHAPVPARAGRAHGELGLLGIAVPEEWGGAGMDTLSYVLAMEEISRACASTGVIM